VAEDGSVLIADTINNVVRRVRTNGTIVSIAGTGAEGSAVGRRAADKIGFNAPQAVAAAGRGGVLVADTGNDAVRLISAEGVVTTLVGASAPIRVDLKAPGDVTSLRDGSYLIADTGHHRVLRVTSAGAVQSIAGTQQAGYTGDGGFATAARLSRPAQVAAAPDGSVLIADTGNGAVRRVLPSGVIETVTRGLSQPGGVVGLPDGAVLVASVAGLYRVEPDGSRRRIAGGATRGYNGDRGQALALRFDGLAQLALEASGGVLFAERGSDRIRRLDVGGTVDTVAGSGMPRSAPKVGVPAGAFPPELTVLATTGSARQVAPVGRAASASACEFYDPRFATFSLIPATETTLKVKGHKVKKGRSQIKLRLATSRTAAVVVELTREHKPGGRAVRHRMRDARSGRRIRVTGRFAKRTYIARIYGVSVNGHIQRCDVKRVRVR
jgi:serine/threonine-protein kinase